ncbi:hypothetical protein WJX81_002533 [Elliptochloris bilobata]|uniref:Sugar phosphate transporter domain-containing protein n=1 Tax=Elliptochloris bilobata TaxID=381761 RepID=A0AAW1RSU0_9CHLO
MLNRWVLGVFGFRFPIFLTSCHLLQGFCILSPFMALPANARLHRATLEKQGRGIAAVGVFKVANIALNNMSLVFLSLSLSQIIRSGIPVMTALVGVAIEKKVPTPFELLSLVILTAGVVLSVWEGSVSGSTVGIGLSLASVLCGAAMLSFSGRALSEELDVFRLTFYTAPVSVAVLLPVLLWQEVGPLTEYWSAQGTWALVAYLLSGGMIAMLYNIVHYRMIQITSATLTPVIGMIKVVGIVVLSAAFLGERDIFTVRMVIGCTLAVMGRRSQRRGRPPAANQRAAKQLMGGSGFCLAP